VGIIQDQEFVSNRSWAKRDPSGDEAKRIDKKEKKAVSEEKRFIRVKKEDEIL
jgi:hypothetical protein